MLQVIKCIANSSPSATVGRAIGLVMLSAVAVCHQLQPAMEVAQATEVALLF